MLCFYYIFEYCIFILSLLDNDLSLVETSRFLNFLTRVLFKIFNFLTVCIMFTILSQCFIVKLITKSLLLNIFTVVHY